MILVPVISFLGCCLALSLATGWAIEAMPLLAASTLIASLYLASLAGALAAAAKAFLWAGLLLFAGSSVFIFLSGQKRRDLFNRLLTPGFALFASALPAAWFKMRGESFLEWDAFSHWGLAIKDMVLSGALPSSASAVLFRDYPPGATLFHYFMAAPAGYSEGNAFFSHSVLLLCAAAVFTGGFPRRKFLGACAGFLLPCLLLSVFGFEFRAVMVDSLIGLFAGAALAGYFLSEDFPAAAALRSAPVLFVLPLFKPVGALLGFVAAAAMAADIVYRAWGGGPAGAAGSRSRSVPYALLISALLLLAPAVSSKSWSHRVKALDLGITLNADIPASKVIGSFSSGATARDKTTIANFAAALFKKKMGKPRLPPLIWAALFLAAAAMLFYRSGPAERFQVASSQAVMAAGFAAYSFGLLVLYLHGFVEYEGIRLASFTRYMGLFLLAWSAALAGLAVRWFRGKEGWNISPFYAAALAAIVLAAWAFVPGKRRDLAIREIVARAVAPAKEMLKPGDRVYLIWQNTNGYEYCISLYELLPARSLRDPFSIGRKYGENDVWTQDLAVRDWAVMLARNDYLLVARADAAFWERYGRLFSGNPRACGSGLFRVRGGEGSVSLECFPQG